MDTPIQFPNIIEAHQYNTGNILLVFGDRESGDTKRFVISKETAKMLGAALLQQTNNLNHYLN